jgi:hypothetical protein
MISWFLSICLFQLVCRSLRYTTAKERELLKTRSVLYQLFVQEAKTNVAKIAASKQELEQKLEHERAKCTEHQVGLYKLNPGDPQLERRLVSTLEPINGQSLLYNLSCTATTRRAWRAWRRATRSTPRR